jgi:hypothetical protein
LECPIFRPSLPVDDQPGEQPGPGADTGSKRGIATDGSRDRSDACAGGRPRECALLGRI